MLAQNKAEEASRHEQGTIESVESAFSRHPNVRSAAEVGEPTLQDQDLISAKDLVEKANQVVSGKSAQHSVTAKVVNDNASTENQPAPTTDNPAKPLNPEEAITATDAGADPNELKPTVAATGSTPTQPAAAAPDPNELTPNLPQDAQPAPAPAQVNEIARDRDSNGGGATATAGAQKGSDQDLADDQMISSSKHKKKKGLEKIIPHAK